MFKLLELNQLMKLFDKYVIFKVDNLKILVKSKMLYFLMKVTEDKAKEYKYEIIIQNVSGNTFKLPEGVDNLYDIVEYNKEFKIVALKLVDERERKKQKEIDKEVAKKEEKEVKKDEKNIDKQNAENLFSVKPPVTGDFKDLVDKNINKEDKKIEKKKNTKELINEHFPEPKEDKKKSKKDKKGKKSDMYKLIEEQLGK